MYEEGKWDGCQGGKHGEVGGMSREEEEGGRTASIRVDFVGLWCCFNCIQK